MQTEEQKKQKKQLILVGVIIAITVGVLLYSKRGKSTQKTTTPAINVPPVVSINAQLKGIEGLDLGVLLEDSFVDLEKIEGYPIDPGDVGRNNPFIPYE